LSDWAKMMKKRELNEIGWVNMINLMIKKKSVRKLMKDYYMNGNSSFIDENDDGNCKKYGMRTEKNCEMKKCWGQIADRYVYIITYNSITETMLGIST
jgi:hypothetical protein